MRHYYAEWCPAGFFYGKMVKSLEDTLRIFDSREERDAWVELNPENAVAITYKEACECYNLPFFNGEKAHF